MRAAALLPILMLPACDSEPEIAARNASVDEVAQQVRQAGGANSNFIRPGKWVSTVNFEELNAPGMPPQVAQQMRNMMPEGQTHENCLTEEDAERPSEGFFTGEQNDQCRYEHFTMGGGKIDAKMRCSQGAINQVMEMQGTYSPEQYELRMTSSMQGAPEPASNMSMRMRIKAERVGECEPAAG